MLPTARGIGDAPVDARVGHIQPDEPVVLGQHQSMQSLVQPGCGPDLHPASNRAVRAARAGYAFIAGPMHQRGDHLLNDDPVQDAAITFAIRRRSDDARGRFSTVERSFFDGLAKMVSLAALVFILAQHWKAWQ